MKAAERTISSAAKFGLSVEKFKAITPHDKPLAIAEKEQIPIKGFIERFSRFENCLSAFLSHYSLWQKAAKENQHLIIFEHDAVVVNNIPPLLSGDIVNLGKPSYGGFNAPMTLGEGPLVSKQYFPGAHGYSITPRGAEALISKAKLSAQPTDVFINTAHFNKLTEFYPWPVEARDSFTTIQNNMGCTAKHNYGENYVIETV